MPRHADDQGFDPSPEPPTDPGFPLYPTTDSGFPLRPTAGTGFPLYPAADAGFELDPPADTGLPLDPTASTGFPLDPTASIGFPLDPATDQGPGSQPPVTGLRARHRAIVGRRARTEGGGVRIVSPRTVRIMAYALGLALLISGFAAVKLSHQTSASNTTATGRDDERASRGEVRAPISPGTTTTLATALATADPAAILSQAPLAAPATAPPAPVVTKAPPAPAKKVTPKATVAAPANAAGCAGYSGNRLVACNLLPSFGFSTSEMSALDPMWNNESGWNASAENPGSGAYGIPQALPGSKMASAGSDWQTNPATQIKWGLGYIKDRYGSPSAAWSFWQANGWY